MWHFVCVFFLGRFIKGWEEKKIRKIIEKEEKK